MRGLFQSDDWREFMRTVHSRRSTAILALLLITVSLLSISFQGKMAVETAPFHHVDTIPRFQSHMPHSTSNRSPGSEPERFDAVSSPDALRTPLGTIIPLRIMFLDASVIRDDVSISNVGYHLPLRDRFSGLRNPVNFVEFQRLKGFTDNDVETYLGNRIDQIHEYATHIVPVMRPNVLVLHVGSDDCLQKYHTADAGKRMHDLVIYLLRTSPQTTVVLSTLLTSTVHGNEVCILDLNVQIRKVASALQREGQPVVLAEMHYEQGLPDRPLPADISPDGTHPSDRGYQMMGNIFFDAIIEASHRRHLKLPEDMADIHDDDTSDIVDEPYIFTPEPPMKGSKQIPIGSEDATQL